MRANKKLLISILSAVACAAILLSVLLYFYCERLKEANYALTVRLSAHDVRSQATTGNNSKTEAAKTSPAASVAPGKDKALFVNSKDPRRDPKQGWLGQRMFRRDIWRFYGSGIRQLGLSPEQEAHLEALLIARSETLSDTFDAAGESRLSNDEIQSIVRNGFGAIDADITSMIGKNGQRILQESSDIQTMRNQINNGVGIDFYAANQNITDDQKNQLALVMSQAQGSAYPQDVPDDSPGSKGELSKAGAAIVEKASAFLSSEQLSILRSYEVEQFRQWQYYEGR
jgi:hypothetical protein